MFAPGCKFCALATTKQDKWKRTSIKSTWIIWCERVWLRPVLRSVLDFTEVGLPVCPLQCSTVGTCNVARLWSTWRKNAGRDASAGFGKQHAMKSTSRPSQPRWARRVEGGFGALVLRVAHGVLQELQQHAVAGLEWRGSPPSGQKAPSRLGFAHAAWEEPLPASPSLGGAERQSTRWVSRGWLHVERCETVSTTRAGHGFIGHLFLLQGTCFFSAHFLYRLFLKLTISLED